MDALQVRRERLTTAALRIGNDVSLCYKARDRRPRQQLLDVLTARIYRAQAWDRLASALRFDGRVGWTELVDIHLERAVELERTARLLETCRRL